MDLQDAGCRARFLIRDRDSKSPGLFDAVLGDAGIEVVLTGVRMPRMNSVMERWIQTCRHELPGRTLIWNHHHLLRAPRKFEDFYNEHRPHQGLANAWAEPSTSTSTPPDAMTCMDEVSARTGQDPAPQPPRERLHRTLHPHRPDGEHRPDADPRQRRLQTTLAQYEAHYNDAQRDRFHHTGNGHREKPAQPPPAICGRRGAGQEIPAGVIRNRSMSSC